MDSQQKDLWASLDLTRKEQDPQVASAMINERSKELLSPEVHQKLDEVVVLAHQEIERLGGNPESAKRGVDNMAKNLYRAIVHTAIPDEVVDAKCPRFS